MASSLQDTQAEERTVMDLFEAALMREAPCSGRVGKVRAAARPCVLNRGESAPLENGRDWLVFVAKGVGKLVSASESGRSPAPKIKSTVAETQIVGFCFPRDIVCLSRGPGAHLSFVATGPSTAVTLPVDSFLDAARGEAELVRGVLNRSLGEMERSRMRMMQMRLETPRARIAGFLAAMARRICGCSNGACRLALPMGRGDIAASLALTVEALENELKEMQYARILYVAGRSIDLTDVGALDRESRVNAALRSRRCGV